VEEQRKARKRKRPDGDSSIRYSETKKLWIGRVMVGYRPDGRPDVREVAAKQQGECRKKLDGIKAKMREGTLGDIKSGRETVSAYLDWWVTSIEGTIEADSLRRHRDGIKRMKPLIGRHKLTDLRPEHVVTMLTTLRATTYKRGRTVTLGPSHRAPSATASSRCGRRSTPRIGTEQSRATSPE